MRHYKIMALCLSMLVIPTVATAQTNVKKAFDKFLNSSKVVYTERHSLDKDPETNEKAGSMTSTNTRFRQKTRASSPTCKGRSTKTRSRPTP